LGEKEIDVSFIPCGITFEVDKIVQELYSMKKEEIADNGEGTKRALELSIKLCSLFCEHKYPELDEEYFKWNVDGKQLKNFADSIQDALMRAYNGIGNNPKNGRALRKKNR
jgi:hypothetical protein